MNIVSIRKRIVNSLIVPLTGAAGVLSGVLYVGIAERPPQALLDDSATTGQITPMAVPTPDRLREAFRLVSMVESGGDPQAVGPCGEMGIVQIMPGKYSPLHDVNRILGRAKYTMADRRDVGKSYDIFRIYCRYYYPHGSIEQWARLWHRGPGKKAQYDRHGDAYWKKIEEVMS